MTGSICYFLLVFFLLDKFEYERMKSICASSPFDTFLHYHKTFRLLKMRKENYKIIFQKEMERMS